MTNNAKQGHEDHGADPGLSNTVARYRDGGAHGERGWYITTDRENGDAPVTSGPYPLDDAQTTLQLINGGHDDDHETDFSPEEVTIEEGHVTRIEDTAGQLATAMSTGNAEELQARKDQLAALMTATNDYTNWCED